MTFDFKLGYVPALDGIRGVAILAVVFYHSGWMVGGFLGVDVFFVLSGFLITSLLLEEWNRSGKINLKAFYLRRILRLLPALAVMLTVWFLYETFYLPLGDIPITTRVLYALSYAANWFQIYYGRDVLTTLGIVWSLAIEEQFYIVWPPLLRWLLGKGVSARQLALILGVLIISVIIRRHYLLVSGAGFFRIMNGTDSHADVILTGCLLAVIVRFAPPDVWRQYAWASNYAGRVGLIGLAVLTGLGLLIVGRDYASAYVHAAYVAISLFTSLVILAATVCPSPPVKSLLERGPIVWLGKLSYGIYLWHGTAGIYLFYHFGMPAFGRLAVGLVLAAMSYYGLERPCLRLKDRLRGKTVAMSHDSSSFQ